MPNKPALLITAALLLAFSTIFAPARAEITDILPRIKASIAGIGTVHPLRSPRN